MTVVTKNEDKIGLCIENYLKALKFSKGSGLMFYVNPFEVIKLLEEQSIKVKAHEIMPLFNKLMFGKAKVANFEVVSTGYNWGDGMKFRIIKVSELK
jgi:hypothetical protein